MGAGDRYRVFTAVYLLPFREGKVLLLKRRNTGFRDGEYGLVSGHVEEGETWREAMIREAREEAGIEVAEENLEPVHVMHRNSDDRRYVDVFFASEEWEGKVKNREPEKCADLSWFSPDELPDNTINYIQRVIERSGDGDFFSEFGW